MSRPSTHRGILNNGGGSNSLRAHQSLGMNAMSSQFPPQQLQYDTQGQVVMTASHQRVKDKQREWEGFVKILRQTKQLEGFIKDLGEKTELLEDGGEAIAKVVENWQNVFRATHVALAAMAARQAAGEGDVQTPVLVRLPVAAPREDTENNGTVQP